MQFAEEKAVVSNVDGDFVFLQTLSKTSCSNCYLKSGCGQVSTIFTLQRNNKLKINNTLNLHEGDSVIVGMAPDKLLIATVLMYLSPLLLLFVFSFIAKILLGEYASIIFGMIGLFSGLLLVKKITQQKSIASSFQPKLIRKIITVNQA